MASFVFPQTPTGQKVLQKMPAVAQQSAAAGQQWGKAMADLQARIVDELRKRGHDI